jgi:ribonuclease BN (tRNA processing enzyme)
MIPELGFVFDAGSAFFRVLPRVQTPVLDVFLSHAHLDHICGIAAVLSIVSQTQCKTVRVHGLTEVLAAVQTLLRPPIFPIEIPIEYVELSPEPLVVRGVTVTHFALKHRGACVGYRVEGPGVSFAYVTDTRSNEESVYAGDVAGVGVLAHEMYCGVDEEGKAWEMGHTSVTGLMGFAEKCGAKRVVAIHHNPDGDLKAIAEDGVALIPGLIFAWDGLEIALAQ